jgi:hypothetical protein
MIRRHQQSGVYEIVCVSTGERYVGQSVCMRSRLRGHLNELRGRKHKNAKLQAVYDKVGRRGLRFLTIQRCEFVGLNAAEAHWIAERKACLNQTGAPRTQYWVGRNGRIHVGTRDPHSDLDDDDYEDELDEEEVDTSREVSAGLMLSFPQKTNPDFRPIIDSMLRRIGGQKRDVIERKYGIDRPAQHESEIAESLGLSRRRIDQIESAAIIRLREIAENSDIFS